MCGTQPPIDGLYRSFKIMRWKHHQNLTIQPRPHKKSTETANLTRCRHVCFKPLSFPPHKKYTSPIFSTHIPMISPRPDSSDILGSGSTERPRWSLTKAPERRGKAAAWEDVNFSPWKIGRPRKMLNSPRKTQEFSRNRWLFTLQRLGEWDLSIKRGWIQPSEIVDFTSSEISHVWNDAPC